MMDLVCRKLSRDSVKMQFVDGDGTRIEIMDEGDWDAACKCCPSMSPTSQASSYVIDSGHSKRDCQWATRRQAGHSRVLKPQDLMIVFHLFCMFVEVDASIMNPVPASIP